MSRKGGEKRRHLLETTIYYPYWQYTDLFIFRFIYIRPCLHETGMKLDRHDFVSVAVLLIIPEACMKKCSDRFEVIPVAEPKRLSSDLHDRSVT